MHHSLSVFAVLVVSGAAQAAFVISHTETIGPGPTDINTTIQLPQFDPSLGPLTGVSVSVSASADTSWTVTWNGTNPSNAATFRNAFIWEVSVAQGGDTIADGINVQPPGADPLDFNTIPLWQVWTVPAGLTQGQSETFTDPDWGIAISNTVNPGDFTPYIGVGTVPFDVQITALFGISSPSNWSNQLMTIGEASITVEYTYIPTPSAVGLFALAGIASVRRRRSA